MVRFVFFHHNFDLFFGAELTISFSFVLVAFFNLASLLPLYLTKEKLGEDLNSV